MGFSFEISIGNQINLYEEYFEIARYYVLIVFICKRKFLGELIFS
jgi:hypothetical protein